MSTTSLCTRQHYVSPPSQKKGLQWVAAATESVWPRAIFLCSKVSPIIPLHISATADLRPASSATCSSGTIMSVPVQQLTILLSSILSGGVFRVTGELLHQDYCALCLAQLSAAAALYNPIHGFSFAFPKTWNWIGHNTRMGSRELHIGMTSHFADQKEWSKLWFGWVTG